MQHFPFCTHNTHFPLELIIKTNFPLFQKKTGLWIPLQLPDKIKNDWSNLMECSIFLCTKYDSASARLSTLWEKRPQYPWIHPWLSSLFYFIFILQIFSGLIWIFGKKKVILNRCSRIIWLPTEMAICTWHRLYHITKSLCPETKF
jgi:hypothetical protein